MRILFTLIFTISFGFSCSDKSVEICEELKEDFDKYVVKKNNQRYFWKGDFSSLKNSFSENKSCILTLNLEKLKSQFELLKIPKDVDEYPHSITVTNDDVFPGVNTNFTTHIRFKINPETGLVSDIDYQSTIVKMIEGVPIDD
ncbi:MAG: hypothetical protein ACI9J3_000226 [Parvicellaceae bacterium]